MKVIAKKAIHLFILAHPEGKGSIESWYAEAKAASWKKSMDIKQRYPAASFLADKHVIFNIKGNRYRLVTRVSYQSGKVFIRWIGTHAEYDKRTFP